LWPIGLGWRVHVLSLPCSLLCYNMHLLFKISLSSCLALQINCGECFPAPVKHVTKKFSLKRIYTCMGVCVTPYAVKEMSIFSLALIFVSSFKQPVLVALSPWVFPHFEEWIFEMCSTDKIIVEDIRCIYKTSCFENLFTGKRTHS